MSEKLEASIKTLARYEPDTVYTGTGEYVAECVRADDSGYYLAADADAAIEALQAEIEELREQLRLATVGQATAEAEANDARAEAQVLRERSAHVDRCATRLAVEKDTLAQALARARELAAKWRAAPQDPDEPLLAIAADELEAAISQAGEHVGRDRATAREG